MKAFILAILFLAVVATGAGFVLEGYFSREADQALALPSARPGHEASVEARQYNGLESKRGD